MSYMVIIKEIFFNEDVLVNEKGIVFISARRTEQQRKEAERAAGKTNAFKKEHTVENGTTVTKVDTKTPTYNPMTGNKQKRLKELSALHETRTVILSEEQRKEIQEYLLKK